LAISGLTAGLGVEQGLSAFPPSEMVAYKPLRIFIGSPGDLNDERRAFPGILEELNEVKAHALGYHLSCVGWEDTMPAMGRPQELINRDLRNSDLAVLLLWKRWGTPTGTHSSGFAEEFDICIKDQKSVMLFLKEIPADARGDPGPQLAQVLEFRRKIEEERTVLYHTFADVPGLLAQLRRHLAKWLELLDSGDLGEDMQARPGAWLRRIAQNEELSHRLVGQMFSAASEREQISQLLAEEGRNRFMAGNRERAEQLLQVALDTFPVPTAFHAYLMLLMHTGRIGDAKAMLDSLQKSPAWTTDPGLRLLVSEGLGSLAESEGRLVEAERFFEECLSLAQGPDLLDSKVTALMHIGCIRRDRGDFAKALQPLNRALQIVEANPDLDAGPSILNHTTSVQLHLRNYSEAHGLARRALTAAQTQGQPREIALAQMNLATLSGLAGKYDSAIEFLQQANQAAGKSGDSSLQALMEANEGALHTDRGDFQAAARCYENALAIFREQGKLESISTALYNLGQVHLMVGLVEDATTELLEAQTGFTSLGRLELTNKIAELLTRVRSGWRPLGGGAAS
jgi:tetratricopeptide (TPR) repeat protein